MTIISFVNYILGLGAIVAQALIVFAVIYLLFFRSVKWGAAERFFDFLGRNGIILAFLSVLAAVSGSLFYSEVAGYSPCVLCWYQRTLMYPQIIVLGMAIWKKDKKIADYGIALSLVGAVLAAYHYLLQVGAVSGLPCNAVGYSASCAKLFSMNFGYITIPLMALTSFLLIILFLLLQKGWDKKQSRQPFNR